MIAKSIVSMALIAVTSALTSAEAPLAQSTSTEQTPRPQPISEGFGQGAYRPQPGITDPVPIKKVEPQYPSDAMRARIQGAVQLEVVILADGTVGPVRVVRSLPYGLTDEAIKAARQWQFRPGAESGKPVAVLATISLEFRLHGDYADGSTRIWIPDEEFLSGVALLGQPNVTMPVLERAVDPKYTSAAVSARITGTVVVDMVVAPDGSVMRTRIARPIEQADGTKGSVSEVRRWFAGSLNAAAIEAAVQWRFKPGLVNGQPANVLVTMTMEFRLH